MDKKKVEPVIKVKATKSLEMDFSDIFSEGEQIKKVIFLIGKRGSFGRNARLSYEEVGNYTPTVGKSQRVSCTAPYTMTHVRVETDRGSYTYLVTKLS